MQVLQAANTGITSLQKLVDTAKSIASQVLQTTVGYSTLSSATTTVGAVGSASDLTTGGATTLEGKTVIFTPATGSALTLTISHTAGAGNVNSIGALNAALTAAGIGVTASVSATGFLTFTSNNDNASQAITVAGGAAANTVQITGTTVAAGPVAPVADAASQAIRANLVSQYNDIIAQITTTAQDSSFNGINLLNGDNLKLTFNETGKSTLNISGVSYNATGLGLNSLTAGTDFVDSASANTVITTLGSASTLLRTEASSSGFEPLDRADPSGLLEEPDQRTADRLVQPDAGRHQRGSGKQPGAVDPPVDCGLRVGAGQPVPAERAATAPLISATSQIKKDGGGIPRRSF